MRSAWLPPRPPPVTPAGAPPQLNGDLPLAACAAVAASANGGRAEKAQGKARARLEQQEAKSRERERKAEERRQLAEQKAQQRVQKQQEKAAEKAAKAAEKVAKAAAKSAAKAAAKRASKAAPKAPAKATAKAKSKRLSFAKAKKTKRPAPPAQPAPEACAAAPAAKRRRVMGQDDELEDEELEHGQALGEGAAAKAEQVLGGLSAIARNKAAWIADQVGLQPHGVAGAVKLFEEGNTLPFIARYRKEHTGALDEEQLRLVERALGRADALEVRRVRVALALDKQGALTDELRAALLGATVAEELEEIWAPFKSKRQTRAQIAQARGLAPLAKLIEQLGAGQVNVDPLTVAQRFVNEELGVLGAKEALAGARDIIAERCAHRTDVKQRARQVLERHTTFRVRRRPAADEEGKYKTYWNFEGILLKVKPYQFLAAQRGEAEKCLTVGFSVAGEVASNFVKDLASASRSRGVASPQTAAAVWRGWEHELWTAVEDAYKRLLLPSLEREWRRRLKERAEDDAFDTYRRNLRAKLLLPPLRMHPEWGEAFNKQPVMAVLGVDPAYTSGCKLALIAMTGQVLDTKTVYPHPRYKGAEVPEKQVQQAAAGLRELCLKGLGKGAGRVGGAPRLICSIGNGTASRDTEAWVRGELRKDEALASCVAYSVVDEAGASVYSASPLASTELPGLDVSMRGAVSIARRLLDPLSELVKIDPQSIGVGLYQHDMDQKRLGKELKAGTEDCVNAVGVDLNTASPSLLGHVAGLSATLAKAVVSHREESGTFTSRRALLAVKGLGQKAFHQAAGFLRIHGGEEPLDALPVHPESYGVARALQLRCGMRAERFAELGGPEVLAPDLGVGAETLADIAAALAGTAVDPRKKQPPVRVKLGLAAGGIRADGAALDAQEAGLSVEMLKPGMLLEGVVRNVVAFGAFVDVGVGHDGLLHFSEYPVHLGGGAAAFHVNDRIEARVLRAESCGVGGKGKEKWKIALSMKGVVA